MGLQLRVQQRQVAVLRPTHEQWMDAQRITVPTLVGQLPHRVEVGHLHRRDHAVPDSAGRRTRAHRSTVGRELGGIEMAMGVDPGRHQGKPFVPGPRPDPGL